MPATRDFWQLFHKLPREARKAARDSYRQFVSNPAHPGLKLERLRASPKLWGVRVSQCYRAVAMRRPDMSFEWIWIGTHHQFNTKFPF